MGVALLAGACAATHGNTDGSTAEAGVVHTCEEALASVAGVGCVTECFTAIPCDLPAPCNLAGCPLTTVRCDHGGQLSIYVSGIACDTGPPSLDAGTDVWPQAAPITVVVLDTNGAPAARQRVVFHDLSGAPIDEASTDLLGSASSTRPGIAAITVEIQAPVLPWSGSDGAHLYMEPGLYSVWGVTPGEVITFDLLVAERHVAVPTPPAGVSSYLLGSPVGSTADPPRPTLVWDGIGTTSILAITDTTTPSWYTTSIGDHAAGTITLPAWRSDYDDLAYVVTGAPAGLELDVGASVTTGVGGLGVSLGGTATSGMLQIMRGLPPGIALDVWAVASEPAYMGTPTWTSYEVFVTAGVGPVALDLGRAPVMGPTTLDATSLTVSWSEPVDAHFATAFLGFTDTSGNITNWTVTASGTSTSLTVPQLPRDLAWHLPMRPGPAIQWNVALVRFDCAFDPVTSRAHPWARIGPCADGVATSVGGQTVP